MSYKLSSQIHAQQTALEQEIRTMPVVKLDEHAIMYRVKDYVVVLANQYNTCTCPAQSRCKHIEAAELSLKQESKNA